MTRRKTLQAIAILLMATLFVMGCQMDSGRNVPSSPDAMAVSAFRAMAQIADVETHVQSGNYSTYSPTEFKADDGSVISGTFQLDEAGNVVDADLTLTLSTGQVVQFTMVRQAETSQPEITVGDQHVSDAVIPDTMTNEEERAFLLFLEGFDEAQDEIREAVEEVLEYLYDDDNPTITQGEKTIPSGLPISGTVVLERERGDDDLEIVSGNVAFTDLRIDRGSAVSGTYSFTDRDDYEDADMDISITSFTEDGITISDASIRGKITESEIHDDDRFTFDGSVSGIFSTERGGSAEISFTGQMDAMEDRYLRFPEYELTINGNQVAIGKEQRPFR